MNAEAAGLAPALPARRGPLSDAVITALEQGTDPAPPPAAVGDADPYGDDLHLAVHTCYELHYRGFAGVDPEWEWEPSLLRCRRELERVFLDAVRADVPGGDDVTAAVEALLVEPLDGTGVSHYLRDSGTWQQMREYLVHRSIYHLKEADPHAWVIPRLQGKAKAAIVAVEFDEFGGGRADRIHSRLYADALSAAGLSDGYLAYLDAVPAPGLAIVNLMSLFGLHRSLRGALVGHFAAAEITTAPSARRMAKALRRLNADESCVRFFTEHIEADAVHEQVLRHDVLGDLLDREPALACDVVLGIQGTELLEGKLAAHLMAAWRSGRSSLRGASAVTGVAEGEVPAATAGAKGDNEAI